jgi:hypothetical protein
MLGNSRIREWYREHYDHPTGHWREKNIGPIMKKKKRKEAETVCLETNPKTNPVHPMT